MRFSYQVGMCDASHYLPLAKAAEAAGYHGITIPDSICYPREATSSYPYNKDGSREFLESVPFVESLIGVTAMAAVTETIEFATFVYKLAVRQVPLVAKQVQGIQVLSNNRFIFGVGISPWEEDFAVCAVPLEKRGQRLDEQIEKLRAKVLDDWLSKVDNLKYEIERINTDVQTAIDGINDNIDTARKVVKLTGYIDDAVKIAAKVAV